jgi:hypothetical protein
VGIAALITIIAGALIAAGIIWLSLGRRISLLVDRCFPNLKSPQSTDPMIITFDPAGISSHFTLGSWNWPLSWASPPWPFELKIILSRREQLILRAGDRSFTFGPVRKMWDDPKKPQYQFLPDAGDVVSFTREVGRLPWPTPFTFNILGASVPKWKRCAYDRLRWTKPSGATLEIIWHDEYWFYRGSGWTDTYNNRLTNVNINISPIEKTAAAYLAKTKGWTAREYRLEPHPATPQEDLIAAIFLNDETSQEPGAGKSVILRINKSSGKITGETGWQ